MANNLPTHVIRLGKIKATLWANETSNGPRFNVTVGRLYKNGDEVHWKTSDSFGRDDLPLVAKVVDMAHTWIFEQSEQ